MSRARDPDPERYVEQRQDGARARGDRFQNLARAQEPAVHALRRFYDLEVDTTSRGPHELAGAILEFVASRPEPEAMERIHAEFERRRARLSVGGVVPWRAEVR